MEGKLISMYPYNSNNQDQYNNPTTPMYPSSQNLYPPLLPQPPAKRSFFRWYWRQHPAIKIAIGCPAMLIAAFLMFFLVIVIVVLATPSTWQPHPATAQAQTRATTLTPKTTMKSTVKTTPRPTVKPTVAPKPTTTPIPPAPTATVQQAQPTPPPVQVSQPTQPPAPPVAPPCSGTVDDGVCYSLDATGGSPVLNPPADFCSYFTCVSTFWKDTNGSVAECANGKYTHSYGVSGACSRDGGVAGVLYQH